MFKNKVVELLKKEINVLSEKEILGLLERPPRAELGDYAFPCFSLAPKLRKSPAEIALAIAGKLKGKTPREIAEIRAVNAYVNFFFNKELFTGQVLKEVLKEKEKYGSSNLGKEKIMVEYETPNTNKPLHLGHLRNASIGMSISNIVGFLGNKVINADLFNDRGVHICKAMIAYQKFSKQKKPAKGQKSDHFVGGLYVLFNKKAKENPGLEKEAQELLVKWEKGDKKVIELWNKISKWAISGIKETDKRFGSEYDIYFYESDFYTKAKPIIQEGLKKGIFARKNEGIVAELEPELPNKVVQRADGTSVYITNDLALTTHKFSKFKIDNSIWVVGSEQNLYFKQLFRIFDLLGYKWVKSCRQLSHGMVLLESGKMKSREGKIVEADDFISDMERLAESELKKRYKLPKKELDKRKEAIALSAIKYYFLKVEPIKDILFRPEEAISFEGSSGPYLQYTYARAASILRRAGIAGKGDKKIQLKNLNEKEFGLIKRISEFPEIVGQAGKQLNPSMIANYALTLAQLFNDFYETCPVLKAKGNEKSSRLMIVKATRQVLANSLNLLGIKTLERM